MLLSRCRPVLLPLSLLVGLVLLGRVWDVTPAGWSLRWAAGEAAAAEEEDYSQELPRIPPTSPADALKTFRTLPGFAIEQVAAEPLLHSPVAVAYDGVGRAYVVEMIDYSEQDKEFLGSVRLLEDLDGDGIFDKSTLFADKTPPATARPISATWSSPGSDAATCRVCSTASTGGSTTASTAPSPAREPR